MRARDLGSAAAAAILLCSTLLSGCLGNLGRLVPARQAAPDLEGQVLAEAPRDVEQADDAFRLAEYAPVELVPWQNVEGGIWVLFSKPVVPLGRPGKPAAGSEVMRIHPEIEGLYRWYGSRLLSFEPAGSLEPATEYTVALDPQLVSLQGEKLQGPNAFRFRTPALELLSLSPSGGDVPPEACRQLHLRFNYPVDLATVSRFLQVRAGGRSFGFTAAYSDQAAEDSQAASALPSALTAVLGHRRAVVLKMREELPWDSEVEVLLLAGARPGAQSYGTAAEKRLGFRTLEPFRLEQAEVYDWLPTVEAGLHFNHPLAEQDIASYLSLQLPGYTPAGNLEVSGSSLTLKNLPVGFETSFTVQVLAGLKDIYGQALAAPEQVNLEVGAAASYVSFRAAGNRILEAGFPPLAVVEFQNALSGSFTAGGLAQPFEPLPSLPFVDYQVQSLPRNTRIFRPVDFSPFLNAGGKGSVFARWRFKVAPWWSEEPYSESADLRLQVSDLGLTSHIAYNRIILRVASLASGQPVPAAEVMLKGAQGASRRGRSDAAGLASFGFAPGELARFTAGSARNLEIEVRSADDRLVFRPVDSPSHNWNLSGPFQAETAQPITYLASDRGIYRPGETLSFFGIDRDLRLGRLEERGGGYTVELRQGWSGEAVHGAAAGTLSPSGRFWGSLRLPEGLEPDAYFLVYQRTDGSHTQRELLRVAFFRRVSFAVQLSIPEGLRYMGDTLQAGFGGQYLAGGALSQGEWSYWWARRPLSYSPPDPEGLYRGYHYGALRGEDYYQYYDVDYEDYYQELSSAQGSLSGDGTVKASQALAEGRPGRVYEYTLTATVEDIDRQAVSRQASATVFTSSLLIGARLAAQADGEAPLYFVEKGRPFFLQVALVRPDGSRYQPGAEVEGRLLRENWKLVREQSSGGRVDTRWVREELEERRFRLKPEKQRGGTLPAAEQLQTAQVGAYLIELKGRDEQGREALTRLDFYSTGAANVLWQRHDESRIELVADKPSYRPGERARLLIKSPLPKGSYLLTVEREGILEQRILELEGSTDTVEIGISEEHIPMVYASISSWTGRSAPPPDSPDRPDLGKPRGCFGIKALAVEAASRQIELAIASSQASYRPGSQAEVTVRATWKGQPLPGAEVALLAVDRGVLDLIDYHLSDPLALFYGSHYYGDRVAHFDSRALLLDPVVWKVRDLPGGDKEGEEAGEEAEAVRRDFRATAVFEPGLVTDPDGTVRLRFRLPDQLSTFRLTAVAVKRDLFGLAEGEILVQNPINVRSALPRSLRVGDQVEAGVVITNLDRQSRSVTVRIESDLLEIKGGAEKRVTVPAGKSRELAFKLSAPREGRATLSFAVDSELLRERLETTLPVERSVVHEAFTVVGQTETGVQEGLVLPESFLGVAGEGLEVSLDSTLASSLIEALRFLEVYPYDCLEQRTSKLFACILYDWLLPERSSIGEELAALAAYQNTDGGFSFWSDPGYRRSEYYVSLRSAHLLHLAAQRGQALPDGIDLDGLLQYLGREQPGRSGYLRCYAAYVLALHGLGNERELQALARQSSALGVLEQAFLGLAYHSLGDMRAAEQILEGLRGYLRVGTRSVTLTGAVGSWAYYGGQLQAKAALLLLYSRVAPRSQIAQALADDLLAGSRRGYWVNTSSTGWVLQAFAAYLDLDREREAEFTARIGLAGTELRTFRFSGPSREPLRFRLEPGELLSAAGREGRRDLLPLSLSKEGRGRLYYTATLRHILPAAAVEGRDEGIGIFSEILDLEGKPAGGELKLGQVYRLRALLYSGRDRDYLALRIPLPSGAEAIDGSLATSQLLPGREEEQGYYAPIRRVYDNEVRFHFDRFRRGKREVSFLFRTTTPGTFPTPPATAELMYEQEVFGRTAGQVFRILP